MNLQTPRSRTVVSPRPKTFFVMNGSVSNVTEKIRRESLEALAWNDRLPPSVPVERDLEVVEKPVSDAELRVLKKGEDAEGDKIWAAMIQELIHSGGPIPDGLGETKKEIEFLRAERKKAQKGKKAKGKKKSGIEIEAERTRIRIERKESRLENANKPKISPTAHLVVLHATLKNPATKRVFDSFFPKKDAVPEGVPNMEDAEAFISLLDRCMQDVVRLYSIRDLSKNPIIMDIARIKIATLIRFPEIPHPTIRPILNEGFQDGGA